MSARPVVLASSHGEGVRLDPQSYLGGNTRERNGVGFSAFDGELGHSLAASLIRYGRLSDRQWAAAQKLARKYAGQVERLIEWAPPCVT